jgi:hypothetical protein
LDDFHPTKKKVNHSKVSGCVPCENAFFKQGTCVLEKNTTMFSKVQTVNKKKNTQKRGKKVQDERILVCTQIGDN